VGTEGALHDVSECAHVVLTTSNPPGRLRLCRSHPAAPTRAPRPPRSAKRPCRVFPRPGRPMSHRSHGRYARARERGPARLLGKTGHAGPRPPLPVPRIPTESPGHTAPRARPKRRVVHRGSETRGVGRSGRAKCQSARQQPPRLARRSSGGVRGLTQPVLRATYAGRRVPRSALAVFFRDPVDL